MTFVPGALSTFSAVSSDSRVEILRLLQEQPDRPIADLVSATGKHPNTVREHLQRLITAGYVVERTEHRTRRGRPRVLYSASSDVPAPHPIGRRRADEAARRGDLLRRLYAVPAPAGLGIDAVHQLDAIVEDLADAGFDPVVDERDLTLDLGPCPRRLPEGTDEDRTERAAVCRVHLGLLRNLLAEAGGPLTVGDDAVADAGGCGGRRCVIRLRADAAASEARRPHASTGTRTLCAPA
ncbi:ArsR family transcriptional regulator [Microbacterium chocolatum]|uniref:ArsR family transcriptional regulator n=1 Tax=Microbacterium aurantiacum TaxID=162393 RepID=UPI00338E7F0C